MELNRLFPGRSEMVRRMRALDWSRTPAGAPETWPAHLRAALGICLTARVPMQVWWGPPLTLFYNDACMPVLGPRNHPAALGRSGRDAWAGIWDTIEPTIARTLRDGTSRTRG